MAPLHAMHIEKKTVGHNLIKWVGTHQFS